MKQNPGKCIKGSSSAVCEKHTFSNQDLAVCTGDHCISSANLSSFADGEYILNEQEKHHLQNCSFCQKTLEDFKKLSQALHDSLQEECPPEFVNIMSERVQHLIRLEEKNNNKKKKRLFFSSGRTFVHAAAAIMLFSFILFLLTDNGGDGFPENPEILSQEASAAPAVKNAVPAGNTSSASGKVDIRNIVPVSVSSDPVHFLVSTNDQAGKYPVHIGKEVHQLWLYDKKDVKESDIQKLLTGLAGKDSVVKTPAGSSGKISFTITATRKKAVLLVRKLASEKFRLLSPVPPQPEQKYFYGTGDEKTILKLNFLPSK